MCVNDARGSASSLFFFSVVHWHSHEPGAICVIRLGLRIQGTLTSPFQDEKMGPRMFFQNDEHCEGHCGAYYRISLVL